MSDQQKLFCGSGKDFHFENGGQSLSLTIDLTSLSDAVRAGHSFEFNGRKYIKLKAVQKREPDQHGKTHYVEVDTYKPNPQGSLGYNNPHPQNGHNQHGSMAQGNPPQNSQGYNAGSNPKGYQQYTPPIEPAGGYEDDIPF